MSGGGDKRRIRPALCFFLLTAGAEPGSSANVIGGRVVSHVQALRAYQDEFAGNPMWHDKGHVESWWAVQRAFDRKTYR